ncbi:LysM peptidoglycan-binding domain-containing protein [Paenibacillus herberti]|nr:LysM peptidoglycan-binding domain-containing protein [Paenibacillus herberti]
MLTLSGYSSSDRSGAVSPSTHTQSLTSSMEQSYRGRSKSSASSYSFGHARRMVPWLVAAMLFVLLLTSLWGFTQASSSEIAPSAPDEMSITVTSGDTLWSIAATYNISDDIREGVFWLKKRNGLASTSIDPGDKLIIPLIN